MKFGFYSCMTGMPWGGSEELWWRAARKLQLEGHDICVNYKWWPNPAVRLKTLLEHGGEVFFRNQRLGFWGSQWNAAKRLVSPSHRRHEQLSRHGCGLPWIKKAAPDAILITIGYHPDPIKIAEDCRACGIPYAINVQCASNFFFIHSDRVEEYRNWYQNAKRVYFVSNENQHKLETNIAVPLSNAEIVANPFNSDHADPVPWPASDGVVRLACIGRIHFQSKGQDVLVDVMKQDKWKNRPIEITFFGHDQGNKRQLESLIKLHGLENQMKLGGFTENISDIWKQHHGLLLPSRYEGAPLVVVESMMCDRMVIGTNIGRNDELFDDNESGFIAESSTPALIDEAMERAWQVRDRWNSIGKLAGIHIRERYTNDPVSEFAAKIRSLVD